MKTSIRFVCSAVVLALTYSFVLPVPAQAERRRVRVEEWNHGRWVHDRHGGRLGWWWVAGPTWVYYDRPHSFAQPPQTIIIQQAPVAPPAPVVSPVMYYCKATGTHYPETVTCPGGWTTMTAETPPQP